ncbi:MAG: glycoside hydrolase family 28 protein [Treponema sp.]|nr:glycoside hydrolase family 28 protein [Treponema sp.]
MNEYNIELFGGRGDGLADNSAAFAEALLEIRRSGGGVLRVGAGTWKTGPLELFSHTTLELGSGAVISFIPDPGLYDPVWTRWEGVECHAMRPCVFASGQRDIAIRGEGALDGNGRYWWDRYREKRSRGQGRPESPEEIALARLNPGFEGQPGGGGGREMQFLRPPLVQFFECSGVRLEGITLRNSPFWTLHPVYCAGVTIRGLTIFNPSDSANTDAIDVDSCRDVAIENCRISVGDDGIALKSGSGEDGIRVGRPCRDVRIRDCVVEDGHGGIVIGSETAAGVFDVRAENCTFRGTDRGIRIKTRRGRGGLIENLDFRGLAMEDNLCPVAINMFYRCGADPSDGCFAQGALPVEGATPRIRNVRIRDLRATGCRASAGFVAGLPESPVERLEMNGCEFSVDEGSGIPPAESEMFFGVPERAGRGIRLLNVKEPKFDGVFVRGAAEPFVFG